MKIAAYLIGLWAMLQGWKRCTLPAACGFGLARHFAVAVRPGYRLCHGPLQEKRKWLPVVHGVGNVILLIMAPAECWTGYELPGQFL